MRIIWAPLALERTLAIAQGIAEDSPQAAAEWAEGLFAAVGTLDRFPERGRIVPEIGQSAIRELIHRGYRVIYRVDPRRIVILTVRHGRRLLDRGEIRLSP